MNIFGALYHAVRREYVGWCMKHVPAHHYDYFELSLAYSESDAIVNAFVGK